MDVFGKLDGTLAQDASDFTVCVWVKIHYVVSIQLYTVSYLAMHTILARACGVPVGRCSGGRLAMTLVATKNDIFSPPSSTFLIEGALGSKNLFSESCLKCPKV